MSKYDLDDELSAWEIAYSQAYTEEQNRRGLFGLDCAEIPAELDREIHKAVIDQIGQNPDESSK